MLFIMVYWSEFSHGYTRRNDFEAAARDMEECLAMGKQCEIWVHIPHEGKWYLLLFANNDKHKTMAYQVG